MSCLIVLLLAAGPNFRVVSVTGDGPAASSFAAAVGAALESARERSAVFWSGQPLPDWTQPCPVTVRIDRSLAAAGGRTSFRLTGGQVSKPSMDLVGPAASILADAVPHEVDHLVRVCLTRRPVPRWVDEGCAALWESPSEHHRHRIRAAARLARPQPLAPLLGADYPRDPEATADLYAVGFVLTERLLGSLGPRGLLRLQADLVSPDVGIAREARRQVGAAIGQARRTARHAPQTCDAAGCRFHDATPSTLTTTTTTTTTTAAATTAACPPRRPTMTIYTASWCPPCRQLRDDFRRDQRFRDELTRRVHVHWVEVSGPLPVTSVEPPITALPTFAIGGRRKTGYRGAENLLAAIDRLRVVEQPPVKSDAVPTPLVTTPTQSPPSRGDPPVRGKSPTPDGPPRTEPLVRPRPNEPAPSTPVRVGSLLLTAGELIGLGTGSAGTLAIAAAAWWWRRRRSGLRSGPRSGLRSEQRPWRRTDWPEEGRRPDGRCFPTAGSPVPEPPDEPSDEPSDEPPSEPSVPFPRRVDEARELLQLRQREGRVAVLDALRGMVVDDELGRLADDPAHAATASQLRRTLDDRVQAIAPLSTRID